MSTLNKDSKNKNMISEIALVFWCLSRLQKDKNLLQQTSSTLLLKKAQSVCEGISKIIQIGYSANSDNVIPKYITNKTKL